ncbi:hypothetical protein C8A03DRAFT_37647 [Achaetomium macrosporum]|uniref:Uncharacterized protein n=1 Tax=Achaetomium macrosporum TaxID=79813 RepID=A0AAN7C3I7_9PEZI|nr:hypothetical protein C8A03DRAFT_37647 [Achaetomium macrosporum]
MPAALSSFTWKDSQFKLTQERYEECTTDLEYTAWIVNELCQCRFTPVAKILHENKAVQRLFTPHEYFIQGEATTAKPKTQSASSAAVFSPVALLPTAVSLPLSTVLEHAPIAIILGRAPRAAFVLRQPSNFHSFQSVIRKIIPVISGSADIPNSEETLFNNLLSITNKVTVNAKPDFYDGARFGDVDKKVRQELNHLIIPTKDMRHPVVPNFFLEAKDREGGAAVAKRQAGLDGVIGARAMHALQNYAEEEPEYDGNTYTYSSTYHAGTSTLKLYAHCTGYAGRAARVPHESGRWYRDKFIEAANARARQPGGGTSPGAEAMTAVPETQHEELTSTESVYSEDNAGTQPVGRNSNSASRNTEEPEEGPILPQESHYEEEEPRQEESTSAGPEPPTSFSTSSMSRSNEQIQTGSKRKRASHSPAPPDSQPHNAKHGSVKRTRRSASE